jgi:hypothetical protein
LGRGGFRIPELNDFCGHIFSFAFSDLSMRPCRGEKLNGFMLLDKKMVDGPA